MGVAISVLEGAAPRVDGDERNPLAPVRPAASPRRGRRARAVVWPSIVLVITLIVAWQLAAASSAHSIIVTTDARALVCGKGQELTPKESGRYIEVARLTPTLNCNLRIRIYNDGVFPVDISSATFGGLGSGSLAATINSVDGLPAAYKNDRIDASGKLQNPELAPGAEYTLVAHITASQRTCNSDGVTIWYSGEPTLSVTSLGVTSTRDPTAVLFGFRGTKQSTYAGCP